VGEDVTVSGKKYIIYSVLGESVLYISKSYQNNKNANNVTKFLQQAKVFETYTKASNFVTNLPKTMRVNRNWCLSEVANRNNKLEIIKKASDIKLPIEQTANTSHYEVTPTIDTTKYIDMLVTMKSNADSLKNRLLELNNQLDIISKEQTDYEHYIEFNRLSASEGYCAYKSFHDLRVQRRNVKDEIAKINTVLDVFKTDVDFNKLESQLRRIDAQLYSPRVRFELFN
jgi:hypothetical protein